MEQILLDKALSKETINVEKSVFVDFSTKQRLLDGGYAKGTIDYYQIFQNERDNTNSYKIFFTIKPYMTNVLFNTFTEIIGNEGSIDCFCLGDKKLTKNGVWNQGVRNKGYTRYESIRDTEYSHPDLGDFQYKCGVDIFNNHILRGDGFFSIKKDENKINKNVFNTIEDYLIYSNGKIATHDRETPEEDNPTKVKEGIKTHLYNHSNILSFQNAFTYKLKEENGWLGFYNKSYANEKNHSISKNGETTDIMINKVINNRNACEFIDMYPDRTLFSLLPSVNENYNNREEYNWEWVLTYPYKKRYTDENGLPYDFFEKGKGLRVIWHMTESLTVEGSNHDFLKKPNGDTLVTRNSRNVFFRTKMKHGLEVGDTVRIIADNKDEFICRVANVGDINGLLPEYYFALSYDDIADGWGEEKTYVLNATIDSVRIPQNIFVSKVVNGLVCDYYIRDFKIIDGLKSDIQKAGFSKTIFGDPVAQIIYSNNLNVYGLKDHNGRDISEIYLTLVKRNKGYNEWYLSGVTHPAYVERSHCFGEVTSGFEFELENNEMVEFDMVKDYNVRMLYNINTTDGTYLDDVDVPFSIPKSLERNLSVGSTEVFCGDFIEFSPSRVLERTLSEVYHRFNTAQREVINPSYIFDLKKIKYDEIMYDDYDFLGDDMGPAGFKIDIKRGMGENVSDKRWNSFNPEGYFYKPHHKIQIKEESTIVSYDFDLQLAVLKGENGNKLSKNEDGLRYELNVSGSYALLTNDKIVLLYKDRTYIEGVVNEVKDNKVIFSSEPIKDLNPWRVFLKNKTVPSYAYYSGDGSGKRMWRKILLESELNQDSDIYGRPYANGAIYLHDDINFYVRRQDPDGRYGLQYIYERVGDYANFTISGNKKDMPDVDYKTIESNTQCEL